MNTTFDQMVFTAWARAGQAMHNVIVDCARWYNLDDAETRELVKQVWKKFKDED